MMIEKCPRKPFNKFVKPETSHLCSDDALDLLDRMLQYDHVPLQLTEGRTYIAQIGNATQVFRASSEMMYVCRTFILLETMVLNYQYLE